jgi:hypothetical protein
MQIERPNRRLEEVVRETEMEVVRLQEQMAAMQKTIELLVTKAEFAPIKMIVYGLMSAVGASVLGTVMSKVFVK